MSSPVEESEVIPELRSLLVRPKVALAADLVCEAAWAMRDCLEVSTRLIAAGASLLADGKPPRPDGPATSLRVCTASRCGTWARP